MSIQSITGTTEEGKEFLFIIEQDEFPANPRKEWDNLGTFYTWENRYYSPDKNPYSSPEDFYRGIATDTAEGERIINYWEECYENSPWQSEREKVCKESLQNAIMRMIEKYYIILPVYKYEHSGIAYNTSGFSCPWDSGQCGYIFVSKERVRQEYSCKHITRKMREKITSYLQGEVKTYSQYANGEVYGFTLSELTLCEHCQGTGKMVNDYTCRACHGKGKIADIIDSCYGFYGLDRDNGMLDHLPEDIRAIVEKEVW